MEYFAIKNWDAYQAGERGFHGRKPEVPRG